MKYELHREQQLFCDMNTAWQFFSSPHNLAAITPRELNFRVLTAPDKNGIYKGMIIEYKVSPLFGIPLFWQTEITQVDFQKSFTDFQRKGPYRLWNHHHEFIPNANGVLMKDTVTYALPFGWMGRLAHRVLVKKKLQKIFDYRFQTLEHLFHSTNNRL